jgi:uncharacterized protein (DUF362 family)
VESLFGIHPFIETNPNAVFIMKTNVDVKTNSAAKKAVGMDFGSSVFVKLTEGAEGFPLTHKVVIKPNLTTRSSTDSRYTVEGTMGIVTDVFFVEGVIESMKNLGLSGGQFYLREVNTPDDFGVDGYWDMAARTGADMRDLSSPVGTISENDLQWMDVPNGVWFNRIPYLWPINTPDTFFINIAKLKAHAMGMTLCAKNLQGTIAANYQQHCTSYYGSMSIASKDVRSDAKTVIPSNYSRHVTDGIPRWDRLGGDYNGGLGQETWASRCLDNNSVSHPNLHVIEGIYGRDGHFVDGPNAGGLANDFMTNVLVFGKNPFNVDIIGNWLAGHEPGNFGLFHLALERGLSNFLNPMDIPVYEWKSDGTADLASLSSFNRTPLKTRYLRKDYNGQHEDFYHLCNEAFDYTQVHVETPEAPMISQSFILYQNYPNPFNPSTSIGFSLPQSGPLRIDILNGLGKIVDVPVDRFYKKGSHMVVWRSGRFPSGVYYYRLRSGSFNETRKMILLK